MFNVHDPDAGTGLKPASSTQRSSGALLIALVALFTLLSTRAEKVSAQEFFLRGGAALGGMTSTTTPAPPAGDASLQPGATPFGEVGLDLDVFKGVMVNGMITYQEEVAVGGGLSLLPLKTFSTHPNGQLQPFISVGAGQFVGGDGSMLAHGGVGLRWELPGPLGLNIGLSGRTTFDKFQNFDVGSAALAPRAGISYSFTNDAPETEEVKWEDTPKTETEDVVTAGPVSTKPGDAATGTALQASTSGRRWGTARRGGGGGQTAFRRPGAPGPAGSAPWANSSGTGRQEQGYVFLAAGTFTMGLTAEDPFQLQQAGRKRITLSPFWVSKREVTNQQYRAFLEALPAGERSAMLPDSSSWEEIGNPFTWTDYFRTESYQDYPVVGVTFEQAARYCEFEGGRLPTEAEWEYTARAGFAGEKFAWPGYDTRGVQGGYLANYNPQLGGYAHDGYAYTAPTGTYPANAWGIQDMSGNVSEWTSDVWSASYEGMRDYNPERRGKDAASGERRVVRGGSWASDAFYIGVGVRSFQAGSKGSAKVGFRCVHPGNELKISEQIADAQNTINKAKEEADSSSAPSVNVAGSETSEQNASDENASAEEASAEEAASEDVPLNE